MPRFRDDNPTERLANAQKAKQAMLERFRARPSEDDPEVIERKAARLAAAKAREESRRLEAERKAEEKRIAEEEAARLAKEQAEQEAITRRAEADAAVALLAEQKAARDARYAARKKKGRR